MARWIVVPSPSAPRVHAYVRGRIDDRRLAAWADRALSEAVGVLGASASTEVLRARVVGTGEGVELQAWVLVAESGDEVVHRVRVGAPPGLDIQLHRALALDDESAVLHASFNLIASEVRDASPRSPRRPDRSHATNHIRGTNEPMPRNSFPTFSDAREALGWLSTIKDFVVAGRREYRLVAYADVVGWLREQRAAGARGGAAIRETGADGLVVVTVVALDAQECLLVDAQGQALAVEMVAPGFDEELTQAFGGASVVIFK